LTLIFRMGQGSSLSCFWIWRRPIHQKRTMAYQSMMGPAKPGKSRGLTCTVPGMACQETAHRVFGWFWYSMGPYLWSAPGPLACYLDPLGTLLYSTFNFVAFKMRRYNSRWVVAPGPGNQAAVRDLPAGLVGFVSRPGQKRDPLCLGGVVTQLGHLPAVIWLGSTYSRACFSRNSNCGSN